MSAYPKYHSEEFIDDWRVVSNGASMMPNTMFMQELARMAYDYYSEDLENGKAVETPLIFRIPKGTPLPSTLVLLHEHTAQFSLQPSFGMPLDDLNERLDEFYSKYAERTTLERWLTEHDYADAHDDTMPEDWMAE
ncbi:hypothetical protein MMC24_005121 [Lignoscripta atroalba]|nr:hypothetical protein [Lignoscripta atroalba]